MASLYITEYAEMPMDRNGQMIPVGFEPPLATQKVAVSGTAAASSAFNAKTKFVRIHTDAICSISFGTSPTATASFPRMPADATEYFGVPVNQAFKVSAITNT